MRTRVHLKGLNWTTKRLANGEVHTYAFAWRGGPRLIRDPGSPEFIASYNEAVARKIATPEGVLQAVFTKFHGRKIFANSRSATARTTQSRSRSSSARSGTAQSPRSLICARATSSSNGASGSHWHRGDRQTTPGLCSAASWHGRSSAGGSYPPIRASGQD